MRLDKEKIFLVQTPKTSREVQNGIRIIEELKDSDPPPLAKASKNSLPKGVQIKSDSHSTNLKNYKSKTSNLLLKLSQWNGCSIQNETKLNFIRSLPGHETR